MIKEVMACLFHARHNNRHNDTVNGYSFTKNYANQIFRLNTWSFDTPTENARTRSEYSSKMDEKKVSRMLDQYLILTPKVIVTYSAAPTTDSEIANAMPTFAHKKGLVLSRNLKTSKKFKDGSGRPVI